MLCGLQFLQRERRMHSGIFQISKFSFASSKCFLVFWLMFVDMCTTKQWSLCVPLSVHVFPSIPAILHVCLWVCPTILLDLSPFTFSNSSWFFNFRKFRKSQFKSFTTLHCCFPIGDCCIFLGKIVGFHSIIHINKYMLVELCVDNYATFDGLVNGVDDIFKASTTYCEKTIIWINVSKF